MSNVSFSLSQSILEIGFLFYVNKVTIAEDFAAGCCESRSFWMIIVALMLRILDKLFGQRYFRELMLHTENNGAHRFNLDLESLWPNSNSRVNIIDSIHACTSTYTLTLPFHSSINNFPTSGYAPAIVCMFDVCVCVCAIFSSQVAVLDHKNDIITHCSHQRGL